MDDCTALCLDHRGDELVLLGHLAVAEPGELVAAALRADLLLLGDLVLHAPRDELALLLGVLATGLNFPVVPKGDEEIRFQISADHTPADIDAALDVLARFAR